MLIHVSGSIIIRSELPAVFHFISDLANDTRWRKEIRATTMTSKPALHARATEHSYLSRRVPDHVLHLECTDFEANARIVYQTPAGAPVFLKSDRQVEALSPTHTRFIYSLSFDPKLVRIGLGFGLPPFLVRLVAQKDLKAYLRNLNVLLEHGTGLPAGRSVSKPV